MYATNEVDTDGNYAYNSGTGSSIAMPASLASCGSPLGVVEMSGSTHLPANEGQNLGNGRREHRYNSITTTCMFLLILIINVGLQTLFPGNSIIAIETCLEDSSNLAEPVVITMTLPSGFTEAQCAIFNVDSGNWEAIDTTTSTDGSSISCSTTGVGGNNLLIDIQSNMKNY